MRIIGVLNEIGGVDNENNSFLVQASGSPVDGLNLNLSYLTQSDNTAINASSAENLLDFYATYGMDNWWVNLEYLDGAGDANGLFDMGFGLTGHMDFGNGFGGTLRYESLSFNDVGAVSVDDTTTITVAGTYAVASNLSLNLELNSVDTGDRIVTDSDTATEVLLEAVGTFGK